MQVYLAGNSFFYLHALHPLDLCVFFFSPSFVHIMCFFSLFLCVAPICTLFSAVRGSAQVTQLFPQDPCQN